METKLPVTKAGKIIKISPYNIIKKKVALDRSIDTDFTVNY